MNFDQLRIFLAVADYRSFTKAAEAMYISHSTTSRNVASLEEALGVQLLERDNRSVKLTPAGELLYREGHRILKRVTAIEDSVRSIGQGLTGGLSVICAPLFSDALLSGLTDFRRCCPDMLLDIRCGGVWDVPEQVSSGAVDVGITLALSLRSVAQPLGSQVISSERLCVGAPISHPASRRGSVNLDEIKSGLLSSDEDGQSLFGPAAGELTRDAFMNLLGGSRRPLLLPRDRARALCPASALLGIEGADIPLDIVLLYRDDNATPAMSLLLEILPGHAK